MPRTRECPNCAVDIPEDAAVCPICRYDFPKKATLPWKPVAALLLILIFSALAWQVWRLLRH